MLINPSCNLSTLFHLSLCDPGNRVHNLLLWCELLMCNITGTSSALVVVRREICDTERTHRVQWSKLTDGGKGTRVSCQFRQLLEIDIIYRVWCTSIILNTSVCVYKSVISIQCVWNGLSQSVYCSVSVWSPAQQRSPLWSFHACGCTETAPSGYDEYWNKTSLCAHRS